MDDTAWADFTETCAGIHRSLAGCREGEVAGYIPQLAGADPDRFGVSVVSVDGRTFEVGDTQRRVCVQSCCKPLLYGVALTECGEETVSKHVGKEPSGASFNDFKLDRHGRPFNPLINAGAIMSAALVRPRDTPDRRFQHIMAVWERIVGQGEAFFDNATYLGERRTAFRNIALAHLMMESGAFPAQTSIEDTLQLYLQACSVAVQPRGVATYAATLANGGVNPGGAGQERIFAPRIVRDVLCVMYSSGMYDYSGRWSSQIGLPAKSGVSGLVMVVMPNLCGLCIHSPRLDPMGNSVRGVRFMERLVQRYQLHIFDTLVLGMGDDSTRKALQRAGAADDPSDRMCRACAAGDLAELRRLLDRHDPPRPDYDRRMPLHVAVDDKSYACALELARRGAPLFARDRWGKTPLGAAPAAVRAALLAAARSFAARRSAWDVWRSFVPH